MSFLMVLRAPITTGTVVVLSLYVLSFSIVLTEVLVSRYSHVNEKAGFVRLAL